MTGFIKTAGADGLRSGFSTGAYAAATAVAAWRRLQGQPFMTPLPLRFADGRTRDIAVAGVALHAEDRAESWAVKDGGDDIDITDQALIRAQVSRAAGLQPRPEDFVENCGAATLILRGGMGVGLVKRAGLDVPPGKWAINPTPRAMIGDNLRHAGAGDHKEALLIEIFIDNGAELAIRTLNPLLGIDGGLSILGTSGLVIPCSNVAYRETIRVLIRGAAAAGTKRLALVTGGRTHGWLRRIDPHLAEYAIVRIGDFIREALDICAGQGIPKVTIGCMAGKLAKYALGHANTHAHQVALDMAAVLHLLGTRGFSYDQSLAGRNFSSFREFLESLAEPEQKQAVAILAREAGGLFRQWAPDLEVEILVFNPGGELFSKDTGS